MSGGEERCEERCVRGGVYGDSVVGGVAAKATGRSSPSLGGVTSVVYDTKSEHLCPTGWRWPARPTIVLEEQPRGAAGSLVKSGLMLMTTPPNETTAGSSRFQPMPMGNASFRNPSNHWVGSAMRPWPWMRAAGFGLARCDPGGSGIKRLDLVHDATNRVPCAWASV